MTGEVLDLEVACEKPEACIDDHGVLYIDEAWRRHFFEIDADCYKNYNKAFIEAGELERLRATPQT